MQLQVSSLACVSPLSRSNAVQHHPSPGDSLAVGARSRLDANLGDFLGFFIGAFKFPFAYDSKRSFWKNTQGMQEIIQKRAEILDTSAIDMEPFDPTLIDAFTNCAPYGVLLPEAFIQSENLLSFAKD
jgi:hypothetical protein